MIDLFLRGGLMMYPLLLVSIMALAVFIERLWALRRVNILSINLVQAIANLKSQKELDNMQKIAAAQDNVLSRLVLFLMNYSDLSREEQKEIVRLLDKIFDIEDKSKELIKLEEHIDLLEKSILSKAFRGELGTNNPEDEPAIKLLERILEEKKSKPIILKPDDIKTSGSVSKPELLVKGPSDNTQVLLEEIKNKYGNKTFRANELKDISELSYDELKDALFELLESKLTMEFDENEEVITYQLKK